MQYLGDFPEDATVYIPFSTFSSDDPQASVTITNLADADIMVHKDGGLTQIATDGATVIINFDSITGNHLITVDTSAHSDYSTGSDYMVRIEGTTVDAGTVNAWVGSFSIENRFNEVDLTHIMGTILTEGGSGRLSAAFIKLLDVVTPLLVASDVMRGTDGANTTVPDAAGVAPTAVEIRTEMDSNSTELAKIGTIPALDGGGQTIGAAIAKLADDNAGADFDATSDSLQAIRDRGDAAWTTGGGGSISDILNITPSIPNDIDLANTATYRIALMLTNALDDLPSTAEITPGTISIDRKAIGGTSWSSVVSDAACSEAAGNVYYDEVFDSGTGYAEGDSIRVIFKSQKITVAANDYEITDATGQMFYTSIRQTMRGTDSAYTGTPPTAAAIVNEWETQSQADPTGFHVNQMEVNGTAQTANDNGADINTLITQVGTAGDGLTAINLPNQTMDIIGNITGNLSGSIGSVTGGATSAAQTTAQNDLDKLTGADGATLATTQGNYAPAKAGDNMGTVSSVTGNVDGSTASVTGAVGSVTGAVGSVTGNVGGNVTGSVGSNLELGPAEVNAEMSDVMKTDTIAEMAQQAPPTTPTFEEAVMYLYMALVHKGDVTATLKEFHNNAGTVIWKKTLSDDGTTYSEAEGGSGP